MRLIAMGDEGLMPLVGDLRGTKLVLAHDRLPRRYQLPRFQIFHATGGFGCQEDSLGQKVYGVHIADNEDGQYRRRDFIGIATAELISRAMTDLTPVPALDTSLRHYLVVAKDGNYETGDNVDQAMKRLKRRTTAALQSAFLVHPEATINDFGYLSAPAGTDIAEVRVRKKGAAWIDAS